MASEIVLELLLDRFWLALGVFFSGLLQYSCVAFAFVIPDVVLAIPPSLTSGALATITFGDRQTVTMATTMTEADFSDKLYGHEAHIVAAFLPKCQ